MNEKIRELVSQATERQTPHASDMGDWNVIEKFAELIIQECAHFSMVATDDHYDVEALYKHFGVEE